MKNVNGIIVPDEFYVVITPDDVTKKDAAKSPEHKINPIVIETYIETASKASAQQYAKRLERSYGQCAIGRVTVLDIDQLNSPQCVANMLQTENCKLDELINSLDADQSIDSKRYKILDWVRNL